VQNPLVAQDVRPGDTGSLFTLIGHREIDMSAPHLSNRISFAMAVEKIQAITALIQQLVTMLEPELIQLTPDDRIGLPRTGAKTTDFSNAAADYGETNPEIVPPFLSMEELRRDLAAVKTLGGFHTPLANLVRLLEDTIDLAYAEAYGGGLAILTTAKTAARHNQPNALAIVDNLTAKLPQTGKRRRAAPPATAPVVTAPPSLGTPIDGLPPANA
jgi:hypothetical protein